MNNLPLKALAWDQSALTHTAESPLHSYVIRYDELEGAYLVDYYERMTGEHGDKFCKTVDEAKHWIETDHYPSKMQPYVKPLPTWIDVSERLPEEDGLYLALRKGFTFEMGNASDLVPQVSGWNGGRGCFADDHGNVLITHWMPIPEFSTMQNMHKGE